MQIDLTVIIPYYNGHRFLERCLSSVFQVCSNHEPKRVIVVDDGSNDYSVDCLVKIVAKFSLVDLLHKANGGVSSARNFGLNMVTTEYVHFLDCDDYLGVGFYDEFIANGSNSDCWISGLKKISNGGIKTYNFDSNFELVGRNAAELALKSEGITGIGQNKIYRTELIRGIFYPEGISVNEDVITTYKFLLSCDTVSVSTNVFVYYDTTTNGVMSYGNCDNIRSIIEANNLIYNEIDMYQISGKVFNIMVLRNGVIGLYKQLGLYSLGCFISGLSKLRFKDLRLFDLKELPTSMKLLTLIVWPLLRKK